MSTPIRRQYLELKQRYPDTLLFFRLGDFYETFDDDARLVARELNITLTSKPLGKDLRVPLAGVPYQSIDGHVAKLVARGYRVAVCEQTADPATTKGLLPREVVRVVTAGTVTSEGALDAATPNYLGALCYRRGTAAFARCEVTTGDLAVGSGEAALDELARAAPAELLAEEDLDARGGAAAATTRLRPLMPERAAEAEVARQFGESAASALLQGPAEVAALAHLLAYLRETYPASLGALQRLRRLGDTPVLRLDERTLRNLDVLPAPGRSGSLYAVLNQARTPMGQRKLRDWLSRPSRDRELLEARLEAVAWGLAQPIPREQCQALLRGLPDAARLAGKVGARSAGPRELHALRLALRSTFDLGAALGRAGELPPLLSETTGQLAAAAEPLLALDAALEDDPPPPFAEGGVIRAGFSPEIDSLRAHTRQARGFLLGLEQQEREKTGIRSLKVGHNRVFGYYIEVSAPNAALVPGHYQRRQTLVGAERYVTEQLKEYESTLVSARDRLEELEQAVFAQLLETLAAGLPRLQAVAEALATIDVLLALAEVAAARNFVRPTFNPGDRVEIRGGRHAVVEAALGPGRFVANDCVFDAGCQVAILTGPNMSGKSTFLRQVALIALMAQAGSFVPADSASLPLFDRIFTRIGAQDDLAAGQSTFMVEMLETAQILHQATPASLVVLDEVGRGTSTFDGMAIARAVLEFIHNRPELGARTLFATHYHELTALAGLLPRLRNFHVAVSEEGGQVVFEHRILPGPSDRSYGIHVARLAGLPGAVLNRAQALLGELEGQRPAVPSPPTSNGHGPRQPALFGAPGPVEEAVAGIDVDGLTPIEAIQKLYELQALARARPAP